MLAGSSRRRRGLAVGAVASAAVALVAVAPALGAHADTPVPITFSANTAPSTDRTLVVTDAQGQPFGASSPLQTGTGKVGAFLASVHDNNYTNSGYQLTSTMTDLYQQNSDGSLNCSSKIPSSAVSLTQGNTPLDLTGITAATAPVLGLAGSLTPVTGLLGSLGGILGSVLGGLPTSVPGGTTVAGLAQTLTQGQLSGLTGITNLTNGGLTGLPINVAAGPSTVFSSAASSTCGGGTNPTQAVLMNGTANPTGVTSLLSGLLGGTNGLPVSSLLGSANPLGTGALDLNTLTSTVDGLLPGISLSQLTGLTGLTGALGGLTGTLSSIGGLTQSGSYGDNAGLTVTPPAGTAPGTYHGTMTLTLVDK